MSDNIEYTYYHKKLGNKNWENIEPDFVKNLILQMSNRLQAVTR